jgi:DNA polymerase III subunit beta
MNKFIVNSAILLTALQYVKKVIINNPAVPILENFLFDVRNGVLTVSGSDLQNTFKVYMRVETNKGLQFQACVPSEIIKFLSKIELCPLVITWDAETYAIQITTEDNERAKYAGENPTDFPILPQTNTELFSVTSDLFKEFKDLLNYTSKDELRPAMTGIAFITHAGAFNMCATNGHTLKLVEVPELADPTEQSEDGKQHFILRSTAAKILADLKFGTAKKPVVEGVTVCGEMYTTPHVDMSEARTFLRNVSFLFTHDCLDMELTTRVIDEQFPQFWNVIPQDAQTKYTTDKKRFLTVLDKASLFANRTTHQVRLGLNGVNKISAEDLDFSNEYCAEVGGAYEGEPIEIGFNAVLLKSMISSFGDTFTLEMKAPNKAAVIREGNSLALCMPVMLTQYAD